MPFAPTGRATAAASASSPTASRAPATFYGHSGRRPHASINFVTAHDGFTLRDLVSYERKHNRANGEDNRDGNDHNLSSNYGVEGPTDDPAIDAIRWRQMRNFMATLFLSQGVPMLLAADAIAHSQQGNNNAYCQDNEVSWLGWNLSPEQQEFLAFTIHMIRLRKEHRIFRRRSFFLGRAIKGTSIKDIVWLTPTGEEMSDEEWNQSNARCLAVFLSGTGLEETDRHGRMVRDASFIWMLNADVKETGFVIPQLDHVQCWHVVMNTAHHSGMAPAEVATGETYSLQGRSAALLMQV
jgi:glycogen operon protein